MKQSRFEACLARILQFESGYPQPAGGPFVRWRPNRRARDVSPLESGTPDGMGYDDDPNDTGGRTCMGVLQRVYDAWRDRMSLARRDVWTIDDREIVEIYRRQYWEPMQCDELPLGLDFLTFDAGVNCGIGMGAKLLQRALGVRDDGHIGQATLASAHAADAAATIEAFERHRETYYRACRTFRHHGDNWLKRNAASAQLALAMLSAPAAKWPAEVTFAENSRPALPPAAPQSVAETSTASVQTLQVGTGGGITLMQSLDMAERVDRLGFAQAVMQSPVTIALIVAGLVIMSGGVWQIRDRARKLILGV